MRQPVIAQVLEAPSEMIVRSTFRRSCDLTPTEIYSRLSTKGVFAIIRRWPEWSNARSSPTAPPRPGPMTGWRIGFASNPVLAPQFVRWVDQHGLLRFARQPVGGGRGDQRPAGRCGKKMRAFVPRAARPDRGLLNQCRASPARPGGAFYAWPNVTEACRMVGVADSEEFRKRLLNEAGVAVLADDIGEVTSDDRLIKEASSLLRVVGHRPFWSIIAGMLEGFAYRALRDFR